MVGLKSTSDRPEYAPRSPPGLALNLDREVVERSFNNTTSQYAILLPLYSLHPCLEFGELFSGS